MNTRKNIWLMAIALWGGYAAGQSRLFDRVAVDFPNEVNVAGKVLHAGSYEIRQLRNSASGARVLFVTDKGGTGFEVEAATIPVLDNLTPTKTHLVLRRSGGMDYLRQVWIEGKNYGYEFTTSDQGQSSSASNNEVSLTATYTADAPAVFAQNQPEPAREPTPPPAAPTPSPAPPPEQNQAQNAPPAPQEQAQVQNAPPEPAPAANEDAQRTTQEAPADRLPATAMNWMAYFVGGMLFVAAAVLLTMFRARKQA